MDILEAFDLTGSLRAAADLAGCDHKTVARYVRLRDAGQGPDERQRRPRVIDPFLDKIVELVERSGGRIRASEVHRRITTMGFTGVERTTRQAVAEVKREFRAGQRRRVFRPWTPEPGCWLQYDWGEGPRIAGRRHVFVVRVVGVVAVSRGDPHVGPESAHGDRVSGCHVAAFGWGADVCAHR
jgi:hypothetical protein